MSEEDAPAKLPAHTVGEDLSKLSVTELLDRIIVLQSEIARVEQAVEDKQASLNAANSIFKR